MAQIRQEVSRNQIGASQPSASLGEKPASTWHWGTPVFFRTGDPWSRLLISGWSHSEAEFTWSDGKEAVIEIEGPPMGRELLLRLSLAPFCPAGVAEQVIRISDGRRLIGLGSVTHPCEQIFLIPHFPSQRPFIRLFFRFPNAISPMQAGVSADYRELAIALKSLTGYLL